MIFAGALLGVCAGLLWTAQGAIMMSYPTEDLKGRYISWFWMIFNLGAVIGGLVWSCSLLDHLYTCSHTRQIPLGQNFHTKDKGTVSDGTYVGFIILTGLGACLAWGLVRNCSIRIASSVSSSILLGKLSRCDQTRLFPCHLDQEPDLEIRAARPLHNFTH